jgi:hypothetical protein
MQGEQPKKDVGPGSPNQLAGLKARLDEMSKLVADVQAARSSGTRVRVGITVVLLALVLGFVWHMYDYVAHQYSMADLQAQMQARLLNVEAGAMKQFLTMVRGVMPIYREEIRREFSQAWPDIRAQVEAEAKRLKDTLPAAAEERVRARLDEIAKRQESRIMDAFPDLQDEQTREIVMTNLQKALEGAVLNVFEKRLAGAQERLTDVQAKVLSFIPEEEQEAFVNRMQSIWDQLLLRELNDREQVSE